MEDQIRTLLDDVGGIAVPAATLASDRDLFGVGLTSFATVNVMLAIEDSFGVEFPDALLTRETFRSIAALSAAVTRLQGGRLAA